MRILLAALTVGVVLSSASYAQHMISAHSGVVQYVEGHALINDKDVDPKFGQFPEIKENQIFRTEEGRAEVLLTPGTFLRLAENSSIKMVSNRLTDTRVEILTGSAMVECDEILKDNAVMLLYKGNTMIVAKAGLYRVDTAPGKVQVYEGEAIVKGESSQLTLKSGKESSLDGALMAESFDRKTGDELYAWSTRRAGYLAKANLSSAMSLRNNGYASGGYYNPWQYNSMFGLFAYVPYGGGLGYSPFGYNFFNPYNVGQVYYYPTSYSGSSSSAGRVGLRSPSTSPYSGAQLGIGSGRLNNNAPALTSAGAGSIARGSTALSAPSVSSAGGAGLSRGGTGRR